MEICCEYQFQSALQLMWIQFKKMTIDLFQNRCTFIDLWHINFIFGIFYLILHVYVLHIINFENWMPTFQIPIVCWFAALFFTKVLLRGCCRPTMIHVFNQILNKILLILTIAIPHIKPLSYWHLMEFYKLILSIFCLIGLYSCEVVFQVFAYWQKKVEFLILF